MTDAHCHVSCGDPQIRELMIGRDFFGVHPWETIGSEEVGVMSEEWRISQLSTLNSQLSTFPKAGVGEIGLDRMKVREVPPGMRAVFEAQLKLAFELDRPVVLHGARCWGQVVREVRRLREEGGSGKTKLLFHGFSRSDGLIPDIVKVGGFISVGLAVLNDHAVNYRAMVKKIPLTNLLVETDRNLVGADDLGGPNPSIRDILAKTAELRGLSADELEAITDHNADVFMGDVK